MKNKAKSIAIPEFKLYYKAVVSDKNGMCWNKNKWINGTELIQKVPQTYPAI